MKDYWEQKAEHRLRMYEALKTGVENTKCEIDRTRQQMRGIKSVAADGDPVRGGTSGRDSRVVNMICLIDDLEKQLREDREELKVIEKGLAVLNSEERMVLSRFFIVGERGAAERVAAELNCDVRTAYRKRSEALEKFRTATTGRAKI